MDASINVITNIKNKLQLHYVLVRAEKLQMRENTFQNIFINCEKQLFDQLKMISN